jgi:SAM-dependent methyltransferase
VVGFFRCLYWLFKASLRQDDVGRDTLLKMRLMRNNNDWTFKKLTPWLGERVLELGSGIGTFSAKLAKKVGKLTVSDIDERHLCDLRQMFAANPAVAVCRVDAAQVDKALPAESFDNVVALNMLEHVDNDEAALLGIGKVLASGGRLLLIVPAHPQLYGTLDKEIGHFRRYTKDELISKLTAAGFEIDKLEFMNFFSVAGWFFNFKILKRRTMPIPMMRIADMTIPAVAAIEEYVNFPFGLSLFCVAKKIGSK